MIDQPKINTEYDYHSVSYSNTNSVEILEWIPEFDIDLTNTISGIKIVTQKGTDKIEFFLIIRNDEGIKKSLYSQGAEIETSRGDYTVKASPKNLTHSAAHLIINKVKDNAAPEQIWKYFQKKLGCSVFCENELSSKNIHFLFSGYMRNIQTEMKTKIPNDIQLLAASYGLPNHK